ncbi:MAG: hypothetical protein J0I15_07215 [Herbaspirillum huttiense]|uniref:hypothetical protein n=1 Tax=Herbaspirillum huttiense TaxID=863372 RepID=UPI001ACAE67B|nr:hypothetical protein [Herbaspirillum huttiense]MBN9356219.1 hypothetical protein [Herbaspirillum huttiense]
MKTLNGYKVIVTPDIPRFVLSPAVPVTEEFRLEFNAWAADFFGFEKPHAPMVSERDRTLFICRQHYEILKVRLPT